MKTLETERLILRTWRLEDLDDMYEYAKSPHVGPRAGWEPHGSKEMSLEILNSFIAEDDVWAIVWKENGKVIGSLGLHVDTRRQGIQAKAMGYVLSADYWGRGIATEAAKCAMQYAFAETDIDILTIFHYPQNLASKRVIEKCGFQYEGTLRHASKLYDGQIVDTLCYSILRSEYCSG